MHEDLAHAERISHGAGMLAARAAETLQGIARHVMAALDRDFLDRIGHVIHRNAQEAARHLLGVAGGLSGCQGHLGGQSRQPGAGVGNVQFLPAIGAEDGGEVVGVQLAQDHVAIGHRQRPAAPVAGWPRIGPSTLGTHLKAPVAERADGAAASGNRVNVHHRRSHPHTRHFGLETALIGPSVVADIGRGAAHVKADQPDESCRLCCLDHADDPPSRPRQDRVLALKQPRIGEAPIRLHEQQPLASVAKVQSARHLIDIAPQDGGEVGIHHGCIASAHQLR